MSRVLASQTAINQDKNFFVLKTAETAVADYGDVMVSSIALNPNGLSISDLSGFWIKRTFNEDIAGISQNTISIGSPGSATTDGILGARGVVFMNDTGQANRVFMYGSTFGTALTSIVMDGTDAAHPLRTRNTIPQTLRTSSIMGVPYQVRTGSGGWVQQGAFTAATTATTITLPDPYTNFNWAAAVSVIDGPGTGTQTNVSPGALNSFTLYTTIGSTYTWMAVGN